MSLGLDTLRAEPAATPRLPPPVERTATRDALANPADRGAASLSAADERERVARRYLAAFATAFVAFFGLVWIYTALMPMAFLTRDYPVWIAKRSLLSSCDLGSASFFGDSRAMAGMDPRALPFPSSNFALSGSSPIESYFVVKRALLCAHRPKVVVIAYSSGKFIEDDDFWNISARVGILNYADIRDVQRKSAALHDDEIEALRPSDHLAPSVRAALFALRFPPFYFDSLVNGYVAGRYMHNRAAERQVLADRGHAFFGTAPGSDAVAAEALLTFKASPLIDAYITATLSALAHDKIPVVVMSLPINDATCKLMNPALRAGVARYLASVVAAHPGTRIAGPAMPCWPDRLFGDAFHLNAAGAAAYTRLVDHWLQPEINPVPGSSRVVER
jgi:hypothetical protein